MEVPRTANTASIDVLIVIKSRISQKLAADFKAQNRSYSYLKQLQ